MRWITIVVMGLVLGCEGEPPAPAVVAEEPASTQPGLPVIVVDRAHLSMEGNGKPYIVAAAEGIVLDARKFRFEDPKRYVRNPNTVHLVYEKSLYIAPWPSTGKQTATLTPGALTVITGSPLKTFTAGTKVDIAIGFEGPDPDHDDVRFTPFWVGSVLFN